MSRLEKLTKEQENLMPIVRDEWINTALHASNFDKEEIEQGVKWMYYASNLKEPEVVFIEGPKDFAEKFSNSVRASVRDSVRASVWASVWDSVRDSVWASVWDSVEWTSLAYDSDWAAWYDYYNKIGIVNQENANKYVSYLKAGAFFAMFFEKKAFIMKRPTVVEQDEQKRLHSTKGPALAFADGTEIYKLRGVAFDKEWWSKIVNDELDPETIFAIDNLEHRRIAYEFMDKTKMKSLKDFKVLDEVENDGYGNPMKIVSFSVKEVEQPLKYLNCFCPSTKREYFIGTDEEKCWEAKAKSFGFKADELEFIKEW